MRVLYTFDFRNGLETERDASDYQIPVKTGNIRTLDASNMCIILVGGPGFFAYPSRGKSLYQAGKSSLKQLVRHGNMALCKET